MVWSICVATFVARKAINQYFDGDLYGPRERGLYQYQQGRQGVRYGSAIIALPRCFDRFVSSSHVESAVQIRQPTLEATQGQISSQSPTDATSGR